MLIHVGIKLCENQIKSCNSAFASVMLITFYYFETFRKTIFVLQNIINNSESVFRINWDLLDNWTLASGTQGTKRW